jgi:CRISPR/Cas system-associated endoribonuclease Cas2
MHRITAASIHGNKKLIEMFKKRLPKYTQYSALTANLKPLPNDVLNTAINKFNNDGLQCLDKLFPTREEFPARHIGPREQEQTQMLELLGFRVS